MQELHHAVIQVLVFLRRHLTEQAAPGISQSLPFLCGDDSLLLQIAFASHQDDRLVALLSQTVDLVVEVCDTVEGVSGCDVVDQNKGLRLANETLATGDVF